MNVLNVIFNVESKYELIFSVTFVVYASGRGQSLFDNLYYKLNSVLIEENKWFRGIYLGSYLYLQHFCQKHNN